MRIYFDKDSGTLVNDPGFKTAIQSLNFKLGDSANVELGFVTGNTALSAVEDGRQILLGFKQAADFHGTIVTGTSAYSTNGNFYILNPSFDNGTLHALLSTNIDSITLIGEIQVTEGSVRYSSNVVSTFVYNDVIKDADIFP